MRRRGLLALLWLGPSVLLLCMSVLVYGHYHIETPPPMEEPVQAALLRCLRAQFDGDAVPAQDDDLLTTRLDDAMVIRIYQAGRVRSRLSLEAVDLRAACSAFGESLADLRIGRPAYIQVERVLARGPLLESPRLLGSMALAPGTDGVGVRVRGETYFLLPSELVDSDLLTSNRPLSFVPDFVFGFNQERADTILREQSGLAAEDWRQARREYFRFRSESFVEAQSVPPHGLQRTSRQRAASPEVSAASLREGALAGGRYLVRHMANSGRYIYTSNLWTGRQSDPGRGSYSLPRHAGTTYFLAELYRITEAPFLLEPIERAIGHLADLVLEANCRGLTPEGADFVCVADRGSPTSDLGSTALAVVALAEYRRATGSARFDGLMRELAEFLLYMQREDGSFAHRYNHTTRTVDQQIELLYYSGEASLALARMYLVTGEQRYIEATERALDWLVSWYDFFLGGFFYGEEHWTCIAAEAAYPTLDKARYWDFCQGYGEFLRRHQPLPGEFQDQPAWAGAYYFTPFLAPQNTPAGSRSEAMISTYLLGQARGEARPELLAQVILAMRYVLAQQVREDGLYRIPPEVQGLGAVPVSPIGRTVRIDYVQHVCSAMIRTAEILSRRVHGRATGRDARMRR